MLGAGGGVMVHRVPLHPSFFVGAFPLLKNFQTEGCTTEPHSESRALVQDVSLVCPDSFLTWPNLRSEERACSCTEKRTRTQLRVQ